MRRLDGNAGRDFPRTQRVLPKSLWKCTIYRETKILLPLYLRILFQPLHQFYISCHHSVQATLRRLARLSSGIFCFGLDCQLEYEPLRLPQTKSKSRENRSQTKRHRSKRRPIRKIINRILRSREPALRCNLFCITIGQSKVLKAYAKKDFLYDQGYGIQSSSNFPKSFSTFPIFILFTCLFIFLNPPQLCRHRTSFRHIPNTQFFKNILSVPIHRIDADKQKFRNFLASFSILDHLQNFLFPNR